MNGGGWKLVLVAVVAVVCGLWFAVELVILAVHGLLDLFQ